MSRGTHSRCIGSSRRSAATDDPALHHRALHRHRGMSGEVINDCCCSGHTGPEPGGGKRIVVTTYAEGSSMKSRWVTFAGFNSSDNSFGACSPYITNVAVTKTRSCNDCFIEFDCVSGYEAHQGATQLPWSCGYTIVAEAPIPDPNLGSPGCSPTGSFWPGTFSFETYSHYRSNGTYVFPYTATTTALTTKPITYTRCDSTTFTRSELLTVATDRYDAPVGGFQASGGVVSPCLCYGCGSSNTANVGAGTFCTYVNQPTYTDSIGLLLYLPGTPCTGVWQASCNGTDLFIYKDSILMGTVSLNQSRTDVETDIVAVSGGCVAVDPGDVLPPADACMDPSISFALTTITTGTGANAPRVIMLGRKAGDTIGIGEPIYSYYTSPWEIKTWEPAVGSLAVWETGYGSYWPNGVCGSFLSVYSAALGTTPNAVGGCSCGAGGQAAGFDAWYVAPLGYYTTVAATPVTHWEQSNYGCPEECPSCNEVCYGSGCPLIDVDCTNNSVYDIYVNDSCSSLCGSYVPTNGCLPFQLGGCICTGSCPTTYECPCGNYKVAVYLTSPATSHYGVKHKWTLQRFTV